MTAEEFVLFLDQKFESVKQSLERLDKSIAQMEELLEAQHQDMLAKADEAIETLGNLIKYY